MIYTKEQVIKQIKDMLTALDKEHLVFLYNSEFISIAKGFKIVKLIKNEIIELNSTKKVEPGALIDYIISKLSEPNQNHTAVVIYNVLIRDKKLKFAGENKFELIETTRTKEI